VASVTRHTPLDDLPDLCRVPEVAAWLDASTGEVYALVKAGRLSSVRLGRLIRVPRSALAALVTPKEGAA
jgi:excisionase family DNA binding protein